MTHRPMMTGIARLANAAFFLASSAYCLLAYSPFAYEQFLKPGVVPWIADFIVVHTALFWLVLLVTSLSLKPYLDRSMSGWLARSYLATGALVGLLLIRWPMLAS